MDSEYVPVGPIHDSNYLPLPSEGAGEPAPARHAFEGALTVPQGVVQVRALPGFEGALRIFPSLAGALVLYPYNVWLARRGFCASPGWLARRGRGARTERAPTWRNAWGALLLGIALLAGSVGLTFGLLA
jgi:hypothetical protein